MPGRRVALALLLSGSLLPALAAGEAPTAAEATATPTPPVEPPLARIALYPVVVPGSEGTELQLIQAGVVRLMVEMGYPLVDSDPIHEFLKKRNCTLTEHDCLGELSRQARSEVTLLMVAAIRGQQVTMYGALVDDDDRLLFAPQNTYPREGKEPQAWVVNAARKFLKTFPFPREKPITPLDHPQTNGGGSVKPPPAPPPPAPPPPPSGPSIPGIVSVGAGLAGAGGGVALYLLSQSNLKEMDQYYAGGRLPPPEDVAILRQLSQTVQWQRVLSGAAFGVGAAGLGAGVYFFLTDPAMKQQDAPKAAQWLVMPGYVAVSIELP